MGLSGRVAIIKIGVIGVGYLGRHHARIYSGIDGVELSAVIDPEPGRAEDIVKQYGGKAYADYKDAIRHVDAVSIVTPTSSHYEIALECLKAGKDLLIEKPITVEASEADELIGEANKRGRIIQVGHLERYNPAVMAVAGLVKEPVFFEAERGSPFLGRAADVDVTIDLMIHDIDIISGFLGGAKVKDVSASGASHITDKLDFAAAWLEFEGGASAFIKASRIADETSRKLRIYQRDSYFEVDYKERTAFFFPGNSGGKEGEAISVAESEPLKAELEDFVDCLRTRRRPKVSAGEGRDALEAVNKITHKIRGSI